MSWIKIISYQEAKGTLKRLYDRIKGPDNYIDNILLAHSLRPHSLAGHMALYKNVLHHRENTLPKSLLETLGVYVSWLNSCDYCYQHHYAGLKRLLNDDQKAESIRKAIESGKTENMEAIFQGRELALIQYAHYLTKTPGGISKTQIDQLKAAGLDDGEVLEANQIISYFAYANRTVLGLGVNTDGEHLGLSPSDMDDDGNWQHQ